MLYKNELAVVPERGEKESLVIVCFFKLPQIQFQRKLTFW